MYWYWRYIDVDLSVLDAGEEIVHRAPCEYAAGLFRKRSGSLLLTPRRVLFLSPPHRLARWRNCCVSLPIETLRSVDAVKIGPKWLAGFNSELSIDTHHNQRHTISVNDAGAWCGAIRHQCELADHKISA